MKVGAKLEADLQLFWDADPGSEAARDLTALIMH